MAVTSTPSSSSGQVEITLKRVTDPPASSGSVTTAVAARRPSVEAGSNHSLTSIATSSWVGPSMGSTSVRPTAIRCSGRMAFSRALSTRSSVPASSRRRVTTRTPVAITSGFGFSITTP